MSRSTLVRAPAVALVSVLVLSGCYSYVPIQTATPGTSVRVHVPVTSAVDDRSRAPETVSLEGEVISAGDTLVLVSERKRELSTGRVLSSVDTVRVARGGLAGLDQRVYSKAKTYGLTALIVAGAAGLTAAAISAAGGQGGDDGPGVPPPVGGIRLGPLVFKQILGVLIR